jgi:hypothetical protein
MLKQAFGLDGVLGKYGAMEPLDGLRESLKYWDWAKGMQEKAHEDYPPLPDASPEVLADSHAHLCLWSRSLILDHVHRWVNRGGSPVCGICGEQRFDPQPMVDRARRMLKEKGGRPARGAGRREGLL